MISEGENITLVRRKHWIVIISQLMPLVLMLFVPLLLPPAWNFVERALHQSSDIYPVLDRINEVQTPLFVFFWALWALIIWMRAFVVWSDYYMDMWVITDQRIIDVEQAGFFVHKNTSCQLENVQNITVQVDGIMETFLDYGTIHVQTAGEGATMVIKGIPRPQELKDEILKQTHLMRNKHQDNPLPA